MPWNFPLLMAAWKLAPALASGNTAVLKPAETTPLTALLLAEICQEAELPRGVVNIVTGDGRDRRGARARRASTRSRSPARPRSARRSSARWPGTGIGLTLELGGKSANIVFEDAALDQAVEGIVNGIFFNQGHVCCAGSRLLLQESVADEVVERLWGRMQLLRVGDPLDKNTDVGAINSRRAARRASRRWSRPARPRARPRRRSRARCPSRGYWFAPTLFLDVAPANRIAAEEIFGPVVSVTTFRTQAEAIEKANNSAYGLAAGVWTDKGAKAFEVTSKLRAGIVWQNTYNRFDPTAAFGGYKESGFGREGGPSGLLPVRGGERVSRRAAGRQDLQAVRRRRVRAQRVRPLRRGPRRGGEHVANVPRGSRKDVRDAVKAARGAADGWAERTAYNRGQILYRFAEALESRATSCARRSAEQGARRSGPARARARRSTLPCTTRAGRTSCTPCWAAVNPIAMPYLSLLDARADRRGGGAGARRARRARAGLRARAAAGRRQHGRRAGVRSASRCARSTWARCWRVRRARRRGQPAVGPARRARAAARAATATSTRSSTPPATPSFARAHRGAGRRDRQARLPAGARRLPRPERPAGADPDRAVRRAQDRLAPGGHLVVGGGQALPQGPLPTFRPAACAGALGPAKPGLRDDRGRRGEPCHTVVTCFT